jgi:DNA-binding NarL/FixJ family response regulator
MKGQSAIRRILVVDDHVTVRQGLRALLEAHRGWEVCGEAADGMEAVAQARALKPDIVVLDFAMPKLNGLSASRQIHEELPQTEILMLTMHESETLMRSVARAGARGCVLKSDAGSVLVAAVEQLLKHKPFFSPKVAGWISTGEPDRNPAGGEVRLDFDQLTSREQQVLQLIAEGLSSKEVAVRLDISVRTAETHRVNLMGKLNLHSVSELVRYAIRNRIAAP